MNPLMQMETTEKSLRSQCPGENARHNKTIAAVWPMKIEPMPHTTKTSVKPPAMAVIPIAVEFEINRSDIARTIAVGIHGAQARADPQRNQFFFSSSKKFSQLLFFLL
jgi:hypothetical protein